MYGSEPEEEHKGESAPQIWGADLGLFCSGLFGFFQFAAFEVKDMFVDLMENYLLELSKDTVRALSPTLRALVGYSIYPPFMGMVNGQHPLRLLDES